MEITADNLDALRTTFNAAFMRGLGQAESEYERVAMHVPSTTAETQYGWLGDFPSVRKWLGERVVHSMKEHGYTIVNEDYELTIGVNKNKIKDDNLGIFGKIFENMGKSTKAHPDQDIFDLLRKGWTEECYDGQPFFDTDHPVLDEDGSVYSVSNTGGGAGAPWFLMDVDQTIMPLVYQEREKAQFVALDNPNDRNVFMNKEFLYGVDGRDAVGYGLWQLCYGSKQPLTATSYEAARVMLQTQKGDHGRPLGLRPKLLVVDGTNEGAALEILSSERNAAGATNKWKGTAELMVAKWL